MARREYTDQEIIESVPRKGFFGHPKGLLTLFITEFWERFSYYGMKSILLYYLYYATSKGGFGLKETDAMIIVTLYGALVMMSTIIGGWFADRLIGARKAIIYGAILIMFGHILMSIPGNFAMLLIALALIIIGSGLLKPSMSTNVNELYVKEDSRIDAGFTIFYMSVNLGAWISPFIVGQLHSSFGFHAGFAAAAVGMFFGLIWFVMTQKNTLGFTGLNVPNPLSKGEGKKVAIIATGITILIAIILFIFKLFGMLNLEGITWIMTFFGLGIPAVYLTYMYTHPKTSSDEKSRLLAYIPLFIAAVIFWAIQEQGATVLAEFADQKTQLDLKPLLGIDYVIPAAFFQSLNPMFIVIFAPVFSMLWVKLGKFNPSTPLKFAIALIFAGLGYIAMVYPIMSGEQLINPLWLVLSFFLIVLGELCISPIGLSTTTRMAPQAFTTQMLSVWFLSNAAAQGLNAQLVQIYGAVDPASYFGYMGLVAIGLAVLLIVLVPIIKKAMRGVH